MLAYTFFWENVSAGKLDAGEKLVCEKLIAL